VATPPRRIYWDACAWIALIQRERIADGKGNIEDRDAMCRAVIEVAKRGHIEILTSTLPFAEVCKDPQIKNSPTDAVGDYFENDYILPINLDRIVGERARALMTSGFGALKPSDALHIASAAISGVEEFQTFDRKLLNLDGLIDKSDGTKLKVCRPDPGAPPAPLLDSLKNAPADEKDSA
jgi:predicted nucleic acid-binding protein